MSYNKKALLEAKKKLEESNPGYLRSIRKTKSKPKKTIIKKENFEKKKTICEWNFKVNELVYIKDYIGTNFHAQKGIALIVAESGSKFFGRKINHNHYYVLWENKIFEVSGTYLRKIL
tara:strand:- start:18776 stop:19129 length:354 start_codon:yes stop_codon:yes gene_type:complete